MSKSSSTSLAASSTLWWQSSPTSRHPLEAPRLRGARVINHRRPVGCRQFNPDRLAHVYGVSGYCRGAHLDVACGGQPIESPRATLAAGENRYCMRVLLIRCPPAEGFDGPHGCPGRQGRRQRRASAGASPRRAVCASLSSSGRAPRVLQRWNGERAAPAAGHTSAPARYAARGPWAARG